MLNVYHFTGPFVVGLEYATDTTAEVVGKPEKSFFLEALSDLGCQPHETVVIGDVSIICSFSFYDKIQKEMQQHPLQMLFERQYI